MVSITTMQFIDTHTHIYDEAFSGEEDAVIGRAMEAGVACMLQPDVDSRERDSMFALVDRHPGVLHAMLGLYPGSVDKGWRDEIDAMLRYRDRKVVALGEIGLDYHYGADVRRRTARSVPRPARTGSGDGPPREHPPQGGHGRLLQHYG